MNTHQLELVDLKREWLELALAEFLLGRNKFNDEPFTTDDIHGILTEPDNVNWYGVLMAKLKAKGIVERVGYQPSKRPEANGRVVAVWKRK